MAKHLRGLLDTSMLIDLEHIDVSLLPDEVSISAISLAELVGGRHDTDDRLERAERQERLQRIETAWYALPFDADTARGRFIHRGYRLE